MFGSYVPSQAEEVDLILNDVSEGTPVSDDLLWRFIRQIITPRKRPYYIVLLGRLFPTLARVQAMNSQQHLIALRVLVEPVL